MPNADVLADGNEPAAAAAAPPPNAEVEDEPKALLCPKAGGVADDVPKAEAVDGAEPKPPNADAAAGLAVPNAEVEDEPNADVVGAAGEAAWPNALVVVAGLPAEPAG